MTFNGPVPPAIVNKILTNLQMFGLVIVCKEQIRPKIMVASFLIMALIGP